MYIFIMFMQILVRIELVWDLGYGIQKTDVEKFRCRGFVKHFL
jgi:hypothetical protein